MILRIILFYIHTAIQRNKDEFWFGTESGIHIYQLTWDLLIIYRSRIMMLIRFLIMLFICC